jgi:hypothetical protein
MAEIGRGARVAGIGPGTWHRFTGTRPDRRRIMPVLADLAYQSVD